MHRLANSGSGLPAETSRWRWFAAVECRMKKRQIYAIRPESVRCAFLGSQHQVGGSLILTYHQLSLSAVLAPFDALIRISDSHTKLFAHLQASLM